MSLRPLSCQFNPYYKQILRHGLQAKQAFSHHLKLSPYTRETRLTHTWLGQDPHPASRASSSRGNQFGDLSRPELTLQHRIKGQSSHQCRHESSTANDPELCAHCGGKTIPKIRKPVEPGNPSSGWHCKPCLRNIRVHGHLPNEEQLAAIKRRRLIRESGQASQTSPCRHCGELTAPKSSRKFVEPDNPYAGFYCRPCVRHMHHHGALPSEVELAAFKYRKASRGKTVMPPTRQRAEITTSLKEESSASTMSSQSPKQAKQSRDPHPCHHCNDMTYSSTKRRLVEPQNPSAGYYCQPCTRCLLETNDLPSSAQLAALKKLRAKRNSTTNARILKSPCVHCGTTTAPGSKRKLVEAKNPAAGYYCRACADCLVETNTLPDEARLAARRLREQVRLSNLKASLNNPGSQTESSQEKESLAGNKSKACAHCKIDESTTTIKHFAPLSQDICSSCIGHFDLHGSFPGPEVLWRRDNLRKARVRIQADIEAGRPLACYHCKEPRPQTPTQHWKIGGQFFDLVCPRCQGKGF
jgi:hypothetical protein